MDGQGAAGGVDAVGHVGQAVAVGGGVGVEAVAVVGDGDDRSRLRCGCATTWAWVASACLTALRKASKAQK